VRAGKKEFLAEQAALLTAQKVLNDGKLASSASYTKDELFAIKACIF